MNAHESEHVGEYESEVVLSTALGCVDASVCGLADLCAHGYVALFHDLPEHDGSAG